MTTLRTYQTRVIDELLQWWGSNHGEASIPLLVLPTGAGKSIVLAELTRLLFDRWPEDHPRTVVIVPSKELAEQNAEKLSHLLPPHLRLGFYSASLGKKEHDADVIVATIGSIYKHAHRLGNIKCVMIDEAHLVNSEGTEAGRYRQFLSDLARYCAFRVVGCTATPFRGNGVWLTDGTDPLFTGIASRVTIGELLEQKYLSPLVRPADVIATHIDTEGISTTSGDYNIAQLSQRVEQYLDGVADEAIRLASARRKWIAFTATVENADHLAAMLKDRGIAAAVVCGETPKKEREDLIAQFRSGELRCLVTVLALATGFDVPDVDCIIWARPTISPVLYVQGAGRGMRVAPGKTDCLWLDFTDTTERMGPVDSIKGRRRTTRSTDQAAPFTTCDNCGERVPASSIECPNCGAQLREPEARTFGNVSNAAILEAQRNPLAHLRVYQITNVVYGVHRKTGSPESLRVDYYSGMTRVVSEWVCFEHAGFAREKAVHWWARHRNEELAAPTPKSTGDALEMAADGEFPMRDPLGLLVNHAGKYPEIVKAIWTDEELQREKARIGGQDQLLQKGAFVPGAGADQLHQVHALR